MLLALCALAMDPAHALASAEIRIDHAEIAFTSPTGGTVTETFDSRVFRTDGTPPFGNPLLFGEHSSFPIPPGGGVFGFYDYTLTVSDGGGSIPLMERQTCADAPFFAPCSRPIDDEYAFAQLFVGFIDGRQRNPFVLGGGDSVFLSTVDDDRADFLTRSGRLFVSYANTFSQPVNISFDLLAFGVAYPVPEPGTASLLLVGLAGLAGFGMRRRLGAGRRIAAEASQPPGVAAGTGGHRSPT